MHLSLASSWPPYVLSPSETSMPLFDISQGLNSWWIMLLESGQAVRECCTAAFPLLPLPLPCFLPSFPLQSSAVFSFCAAVTRSTLPAFLSSFNFLLFLFCSQSLLTLLHWLILFMLCCPLPLIHFPLLFHYKLNRQLSPQPLHTPGLSFTSCTVTNKLP